MRLRLWREAQRCIREMYNSKQSLRCVHQQHQMWHSRSHPRQSLHLADRSEHRPLHRRTTRWIKIRMSHLEHLPLLFHRRLVNLERHRGAQHVPDVGTGVHHQPIAFCSEGCRCSMGSVPGRIATTSYILTSNSFYSARDNRAI